MFIVLTSGKLKEALGSWIGTGSVFCHSFSFSDSPRIIHKCLAAQCPNSNWKVLFHHTDGIDQKHALNVPKVYGSTFQKANLSDHFCFKCWWPLYQTKVSSTSFRVYFPFWVIIVVIFCEILCLAKVTQKRLLLCKTQSQRNLK